MADEFVVNDRRFFSADGSVRDDAPEQTAEKIEEKPKEEKPKSEPAQTEAHTMPLPAANLTSLLIGLATSAFMHMGEAPEGEVPQPVNLPAAQHTIDLLAVLQAKTKGNLEEEENAILQTLLYDLRLKFVQMTSKD